VKVPISHALHILTSAWRWVFFIQCPRAQRKRFVSVCSRRSLRARSRGVDGLSTKVNFNRIHTFRASRHFASRYAARGTAHATCAHRARL